MVLEFLDDIWADCLHYFGKDIHEMDGASAMKLAERLRWVVDIYPPRYDAQGEVIGGPVFRSSWMRAQEDWIAEREAEEAAARGPVTFDRLSEIEGLDMMGNTFFEAVEV